MINSNDNIVRILQEFSESIDKLFQKSPSVSPFANDLAIIFAKYHTMIAPYVIQQPLLHTILNEWSSKKISYEEGATFVEQLIGEENILSISYLWAVDLSEANAKPFALELSKIEDYNPDTYLPPSLKRYYPTENEYILS